MSQKNQKYVKSAVMVVAGFGLFTMGYLAGNGALGGASRFNAIGANQDLPDKLDYSSVDTIYNSLKQNFDGELDEQKLMEGLKSGLANATGDPYTEYFNPEEAKDFLGEIDGSFEGIGAELGMDANDNVIVVSPLAGYPAEKAGLMAKDIVAEVNGESTSGWNVQDAVKKIRGEKGTEVTLTVLRNNRDVHEIKIVREKIDIPSVTSEVKDGVGIIKVARFEHGDTEVLARKAAEDFKSRGVKGVVLDLRNNPGGHLDSAVALTSLWLEPGTPVLTQRRDGIVMETQKSKGTPVLKGVKTVVLVNGGSASASEITAGALADHNAATILGEKTFGKGSVQQPINLRDGSLLKITIARWFTPSGRNIDKEGIEPSETVELTADDIKNNRDPQLDAALGKFN